MLKTTMNGTYKFPLPTRVAVVVGAVFYLVLAAGAIWYFFIKGRGYSDYAWGCFGVVMFGFFYKKYAKNATHCLHYALRVDEATISMCDNDQAVTIRLSELVAFEERVMTDDSGFSGYQFALRGITGAQVTFSTQIAGWAEAVDDIHHLAPQIVPAAFLLEAQSLLDDNRLSAEARTFTAPPYKRRNNCKTEGAARWYDYWMGLGITIATIWLLVTYPAKWLTGIFKGWGSVALVPIILLAVPAFLVLRRLPTWIANGIVAMRRAINKHRR